MASRNELLTQVNEINKIYELMYGKPLNEITSAENGSVNMLTDEELKEIIKQRKAGIDAVKATPGMVEGLEKNKYWYENTYTGNPSEYYGIDRVKQARGAFENAVTGVKQGTLNPETGQPVSANTMPSSTDIKRLNAVTGQPDNIGGSSTMDLINQIYAPQKEDLYRQIMGLASQRGGMDTGGLMTSFSKGMANLNAQKAGAQIDWDKFLKSLELPTAQFNWQTGVQFPEQVSEFNKTFGLQTKQFNLGVNQYQDTMKALQSYYASQPKTNWYDPLVQTGGSAIITKLLGLI